MYFSLGCELIITPFLVIHQRVAVFRTTQWHDVPNSVTAVHQFLDHASCWRLWTTTHILFIIISLRIYIFCYQISLFFYSGIVKKKNCNYHYACEIWAQIKTGATKKNIIDEFFYLCFIFSPMFLLHFGFLWNTCIYVLCI